MKYQQLPLSVRCFCLKASRENHAAIAKITKAHGLQLVLPNGREILVPIPTHLWQGSTAKPVIPTYQQVVVAYLK